MNATIIKEEVKYDFPCLMKFRYGEDSCSSFIVLFNKKRTGTVVYREQNCNWNLGDYKENWELNCFEPFNGEIKLSN